VKAAWQALSAAFESRTRRERIAIALVAVVALPAGLLFAWVEPQWRTRQALSAEIAQLRKLQAGRPAPADPNRLARDELQALAAQLRAAQEALAEQSRALVAPSQMASLLEELLLRSLASEAVKGSAPNAGAVLYRHGLELEVEGSWTDLQRYLESVEHAPKRLLWDRMELQAQRHPLVGMKLVLYTLSTDPSWLQL
jgi:MSHA biogenesis protein MshJ